MKLIESALYGFNTCLFCYGQTGSGKTHTIQGEEKEILDQNSENRGLLPRMLQYLFDNIVGQ